MSAVSFPAKFLSTYWTPLPFFLHRRDGLILAVVSAPLKVELFFKVGISGPIFPRTRNPAHTALVLLSNEACHWMDQVDQSLDGSWSTNQVHRLIWNVRAEVVWEGQHGGSFELQQKMWYAIKCSPKMFRDNSC